MSAVPTVPPQLHAAVTNLVLAVDEALGDDLSQPARLLMFEPDDNGLTFGVKELPRCQHPLEVLMGFVAPDEWAALGAVCHGWATRQLTVRPSNAEDRVRIRSIHVSARDGGEIGGYRQAGSPFELAPGPAEGMVPDALRRALGLPTAPASIPTAELAGADWLDAILDDASAVARPPEPVPDWDDVRWEVITGRRVVGDLSPTVATWMDAGMVARWLGPTYPCTTDHLAAVRRSVDPAAYDTIVATFRRWALLA
ncbi:MAG: hypothetical protein H0W70_04625 [Actinobacteria bacterium]|nr:hypothetical protein [Actinomycetota bacterium]